ncbi:MAG: transglycosylase SLT domain-containing protein [Sphingomonadales bacterium]|nr:transglycosylase SLT domain-containing protein [Sphingomonadales bacterium]
MRGAIARAAAATGVDFSYLVAQARLESGLNPGARAGASSAAGLYQCTNGTWSALLARHGAALGLTGARAGGAGADVMALRFDPDAAARMAAELAGDNRAALATALGRAPSADELYLAHFLGPDGATRFLAALASDPGQSAAALLPKAAAANPGIFYDGKSARTLGGVMALVGSRMDAAMAASGIDAAMAAAGAQADAPAADPVPPGPMPLAGQFAVAAASVANASASGPGTMADTLAAAFALGTGADGATTAAAPGFVRSAYGRLAALGL